MTKEHDSIRRWFLTHLLWISVLVPVVTAAVIGECGYRAMRHLSREHQEDLYAGIRNHLVTFDRMLSLIEREMAVHAEKAIDSVAVRLLADGCLEAEEVPAYFPDYLKDLAILNGVSDISLINRRGVVYASSLPGDLGMNLFGFSSRFRDFIQGVYGRGEVVGHHISLSVSTGRLTLFRYYSPPGSDVIIEIWMDIKEYITMTHSADQYDFMFRRFFLQLSENNRYVKDIDLFTGVRRPNLERSLIHNGRVFEGGEDLIRQVEREGEVRVEKGDQLTMYRIIRLDETKENFASNVLVKLEYDFSPLTRFRCHMLPSTLLIGLFTMVGILVLARLWARRGILRCANATGHAFREDEADDAGDRLSHLSHDLRTPLNAILGFSELLSRHLPRDGAAWEYLEIIRRAGVELSKVINKLLEEERGRPFPSSAPGKRKKDGKEVEP